MDHATAGEASLFRMPVVSSNSTRRATAFQVDDAVSNPENIGLVQTDPIEKSPVEPLQLRDAQLCWMGNYIAVEDGAPCGRGALLYFTVE